MRAEHSRVEEVIAERWNIPQLSFKQQAASKAADAFQIDANTADHTLPARESKSRLNLLFELMVLPVTEVVVKIHFLFSYWTALVLINLFIPFSLVTVTWHQGEN